jgi:ribosomal protein S18 acetylase RimI-like enzyme
MSKSIPLLQVARPEDARAWVQLAYPIGSPLPPDSLQAQVSAFNAPPTDVDESRFIAWLGDKPIARASFVQMENVVELRDFVVADGYVTEYGPTILRDIAEAARPRGNILTVDFYPPAYRGSFLGAGFKQNTRTRMIRSLADYAEQTVELPAGVTLRRPVFGDEAAMAEMAYQNYVGTPDEEMVSAGRAQGAAIIRAMFHNDYNLLNPAGSFLAVDNSGKLVGDVLLADAGQTPGEGLAWIMDISVAPAYRGKGLGKALMLSAMNAAHRQAYQRIGLLVTIGNARAQALYRSLGFEAYGELLYEAAMRLE